MKMCSKCGEKICAGKKGYCLSCKAAYMREWRKTHQRSDEQRFKHNARTYLNVYVRRGYVKREKCNCCGAKQVQAHHHDYSKPLDVIWLCKECHKKLHG